MFRKFSKKVKDIFYKKVEETRIKVKKVKETRVKETLTREIRFLKDFEVSEPRQRRLYRF